MRIGILNTAFVGDLALMGRLIDALFLAGHEIVLFSNSAGCALYRSDRRIFGRVVVKKGSGFRKLLSLFEISSKINREAVDTLLVAHNSFTSGLIARFSRVDRVVIFTESAASFLFRETCEVPRGLHESERYLRLANALVPRSAIEGSKLIVHGDQQLSSFLQAFPDFFEESANGYFICAPGSVWKTKKYPPRLLAETLVRILIERPLLRCVLSGGPSDQDDIAEVLGTMRESIRYVSVRERIYDAGSCLPLNELIELCRGARFVLTPDSAPLHIASATGTRAFAFFGPTPADTGFAPISEGSLIINMRNVAGRALACQPCSPHGHSACPLRHHECLAALPPDGVAAYVLPSIPES